MKWKTLIGIAVASAFGSGGAFAGGFNYGTEVQTPTSVSESAPWRALEDSGQMTSAARIHEGEIIASDAALGTGASASAGASGTVGFDSSIGAATGENVDYWRMDESPDIGSTTSVGEGSGSFTSAMSTSEFADEVAFDEVYIVPAPLASFDGTNYYWILEAGQPEAADELASVSEYYLITPIYSDEFALLSGSGDEFADATSLYEPVQLGSVATYYGDNLALLLDTGIYSDESAT
jgi:hypothetical protein